MDEGEVIDENSIANSDDETVSGLNSLERGAVDETDGDEYTEQQKY